MRILFLYSRYYRMQFSGSSLSIYRRIYPRACVERWWNIVPLVRLMTRILYIYLQLFPKNDTSLRTICGPLTLREQNVNKLIHRWDRLVELERLATADVKRALNLRRVYVKFTSHVVNVACYRRIVYWGDTTRDQSVECERRILSTRDIFTGIWYLNGQTLHGSSNGETTLTFAKSASDIQRINIFSMYFS